MPHFNSGHRSNPPILFALPRIDKEAYTNLQPLLAVGCEAALRNDKLHAESKAVIGVHGAVGALELVDIFIRTHIYGDGE